MKLPFNERTLVMGILNITPDSFSDGGKFINPDAAFNQAKQMVLDGVDIIDVGGESTRPGSKKISIEEEIERVIPVIEKLTELNIPISIDSYKPEVVEAAFKAGASIINDIYSLRQDGMLELASKFNCPVIMMHMQGTPDNMQNNPSYSNVINEINEFFKDRIQEAIDAGLNKSNLILDPGIGFGKTLEHNLSIIKNLSEFKIHGCSLLIGTSRKSFIGELLNLPVEERLEGTLASITVSIMNGVDIVRVHDVKEVVRTVKVVDALIR